MSNKVKLTLDNVVVEGVNIKHVNKASSVLDTNYNNSVKKELKDITKQLDWTDEWIEGLSALLNSENKSAKKSYDINDYDVHKKLMRLAGLDTSNASLCWIIIDACQYYHKKTKNWTSFSTLDKFLLACKAYAKYLEKSLVGLQTKLEAKLSEDKWLLHLTFSKYCYIDIIGASAKKVYEILSDKENHTFVFRLDPNEAKDADYLYHLTLTAIDAEEV